MSPAPPRGLARAVAFLDRRFGGRAAEDVVELSGGAWSEAFGYRLGNAEWVLRFSDLEEDFHKDVLAARHRSAALPIPPVLEVGRVSDGFFAISERRYGEFLETLDAAGLRGVLPALFAGLDAMRLTDISATSGYGSWGADGRAEWPTWRDALLAVTADEPTMRTHGWSSRLAAAPAEQAAFREASRALSGLAERMPDSRHLIHSDLINRNVLVQGARLTAVFDWGSALYGDFLFDLAWLVFWQPWYPAWAGVDMVGEAARHYESIGLAVPRFDERLLACQISIGLDGMAYQAFRGFWSDLDWTAARTLEVVRRRG